MLRLSTFGGITLWEGDARHQGAASQRRRLALLALLAASGRRPLSRDRIVAYLWPEADSERARHALGQSLHAIQRALNTTELFLGTAAIQLNPAVISTDVTEFEEAIASGQNARAVTVYAGPFLDGFHVDEVPDFEQWASAERARHARSFAEALLTLAREAAARRDYQGAVNWWIRLVAEEPLSSRHTVGLMQALATVGDRPGALRVAAMHEVLIREQFDAVPDPAVVALAARLRTNEPTSPVETPPTSPAAVGPTMDQSSARERAVQRRQEWAERILGGRLHVEQLTSTNRAVTTFAAYDKGRNAPVELGILSPAIVTLADPDALRNVFEQLRTLVDPHIVQLYEYGWEDDVLYTISARPDAQSLRDRLASERQLGVPQALVIAEGIVSALVRAHAAGVRHGDLRPKHVLLTDGGVMVRSFGIVDAIGTGSGFSTTMIRLGSPAYLSPEQLAGAASDARVDLYALGCILYHILTGEAPFASGSPEILISRKLTQPPPSVSAVRDSVTPELDAIIRTCLARSPSDRYGSAAELRDALAGASGRLGPTGSVPVGPRAE